MSDNLSSLFRSLHQQHEALFLPNAWDAASACIQAKAGAKAIATSSAALCWALGYPDGGKLPVGELISSIRRITQVLSVPLTVDIEQGYSDRAEDVAELSFEVHKSGAVGINIEDGEDSSELLAQKIQAIRSRHLLAGLFINARTDVYLRSLAQGAGAISVVAVRAQKYAEAGADGLFVPGVTHASETAQIASATKLPLNLMALPGLQEIESLRVAGMRRLSAGPGMFLSAYAKLENDTRAFLNGHSKPVFENALSFTRVNELFAK